MKKATLTLFAAALCCGSIACNTDENNATENNATENNSTENNSTENTGNKTPDELWSECVASTTEYMRYNETISSAGRVAAFEEMGVKLWNNDAKVAMDFEDALVIYLTEEGLDSRVSRREDEHYSPVMENGETLSCRDEGVPEKDINRCVGPAQIKPIILDSLEAGAQDMDLDVNASRAEAALLWFLYVSTHKEAVTCTAKTKDCDSSYAYYTGDYAKDDGGIGLSGYFIREVPEAHDAVWDGLIGVRCWREVDSEDTATNIELRDKAIAQLDKALLYGVSRLVSARVSMVEADDAAGWEWLKIMGPVLERSATEIDATKAQVLSEAFSADDASSLDKDAVTAAIEELYPSAK